MTAAAVDPAIAIVAAGRELLDALRELVDRDDPSPALLDELTALLRRATPSGVSSSSTGSTPTSASTGSTLEPKPTAAPPARSVTLSLPRTTPTAEQTTKGATAMTQPAPPQPTPRKTRRWPLYAFIVAFVVAVVVAVARQGGGGSEESTAAAPANNVSTSVRVLYEVEGTAKWADVTMETPTGTSQISPDVPMVRKADGQPGLEFTFEPGDFVYISAQNKDGYGTISCRISIDGVTISENSSGGGYAIATCKGTAG